jgi:hypothetical protein
MLTVYILLRMHIQVADQLEESERGSMHETHSLFVARKESSFRAQQQAELQALLKVCVCSILFDALLLYIIPEVVRLWPSVVALRQRRRSCTRHW